MLINVEKSNLNAGFDRLEFIYKTTSGPPGFGTFFIIENVGFVDIFGAPIIYFVSKCFKTAYQKMKFKASFWKISKVN